MKTGLVWTKETPLDVTIAEADVEDLAVIKIVIVTKIVVVILSVIVTKIVVVILSVIVTKIVVVILSVIVIVVNVDLGNFLVARSTILLFCIAEPGIVKIF